MAANSDILLGYFDSLLTPEPTDTVVDQGVLSHMLAVVTGDPIAPEIMTRNVTAHNSVQGASAHVFIADTIASGYRLIPLMATSASMTTAMSFTMTLELLSLAAKLGHGRIKQHVMASCAGAISDG